MQNGKCKQEKQTKRNIKKWKEKGEQDRCVNTTLIEKKREIATELQKDSFSVS